MRVRRLVTALLVGAALFAGALAPAAADDLTDQADQLDDQIAATEDDLESASRQLKAAAADLAQAEAQLPGARAAYTAAKGRLESARDRLAIVRQQLRELAAQQEKVLVEIEQAKRRIERSEVLIARIVRYQYQSGGFVELQLLLEAESPDDLVQRLTAADSITDSQVTVIDQVTADKAVLTAREQELEVTQEAIEANEAEVETQVAQMRELTTQAREAKAQVASLIAQRADALSVAREQRAAEQARLARLEAAQEALSAQISAQASTGSGSPSGELQWPIPGASAGGGVGWRIHPVYGYRSCHTGVDISASSGTPIQAAAGGVVVWTKAELSGPYGNNTLIDHGDGLSTFYAHQTSFNVSPGQRVSAGDVIGYVGSTGYSSGPHLHFEVHINGVPHDPMGWFGGSKTPQSAFCP